MPIKTAVVSASLCVFALLAPSRLLAQAETAASPPDNAAAQAAPKPPDDDGKLELAEPDFRLINLPTTLRLPLHGGNFDLTHRFAGNLRRGSLSEQASGLFGIDDGATVGFEFRYAHFRHLEISAYRTSFNRTVQFYGKYDAIHQHGGVPISISALISDEGTDNFHKDYTPAFGAVISRELGTVAAVYAVPTWVGNSAGVAVADQHTFFVGLGGRVRLGGSTYITAEVSPRLDGYAPGKPEYGFAIEKRVGGHMFQLDFTNTSGTTFGQMARGGFPDSLYLGFNLARKFF